MAVFLREGNNLEGLEHLRVRRLFEAHDDSAPRLPPCGIEFGHPLAKPTGAAVKALGSIGGPAIAPLIDALHEKQPRIREPAADALIRMGPAVKEAIPELKKLLNDPKKWTRRAAKDILRRID